MSLPLIFKVRYSAGTYVTRLNGKSASCTAGPEQAVRAVLAKLYDFHQAERFKLTEQKSTQIGVRLFEAVLP